MAPEDKRTGAHPPCRRRSETNKGSRPIVRNQHAGQVAVALRADEPLVWSQHGIRESRIVRRRKLRQRELLDEIKFTSAKRTAEAAAESLRAQFREADWKEDFVSVTAMAGTLSFSKEKQSLTLSYTDTGPMPSEVSLSAMRAEPERR